MVTDEQIKEWKRLAGAAEAGPWTPAPSDNPQTAANRAFIAAARSAVPELVQEVERLKAYLKAIVNEEGTDFDAADFMHTTAENAIMGQAQEDVWPARAVEAMK